MMAEWLEVVDTDDETILVDVRDISNVGRYEGKTYIRLYSWSEFLYVKHSYTDVKLSLASDDKIAVVKYERKNVLKAVDKGD